MDVILYILIGLILWFPCTLVLVKVEFKEWDWGFAAYTFFIALVGWPFLLIVTPIMLCIFLFDKHCDEIDILKKIKEKLDKICK